MALLSQYRPKPLASIHRAHCLCSSSKQRTLGIISHAGYSLERYHPAVLVLCGSFNPPTFMHLRMLELAQQALAKVGCFVLCFTMPAPSRPAFSGWEWLGLAQQALAKVRFVMLGDCRLATLISLCSGLGCYITAPPTLAALLHPPLFLQSGFDVLCCYMSHPTIALLAHLFSVQLQSGFDVLGCYMSPVNDAYWKAALAGGRHRVRMCQLATADSGAACSHIDSAGYQGAVFAPAPLSTLVVPHVPAGASLGFAEALMCRQSHVSALPCCLGRKALCGACLLVVSRPLLQAISVELAWPCAGSIMVDSWGLEHQLLGWLTCAV